MPKFDCSYAYDVSCYRDLVIEAADEEDAQRILEEALKNGRFEDVSGAPDWSTGPTNERVFVSGLADDQNEDPDDLESLQ